MRRIVGGLMLVSSLVMAGCEVDQAADIQKYRDVLDAGAPAEVREPLPGEAITIRQAMFLANRKNEQLGLDGESYVQALIDQERAVSVFLPSLSLSSGFSFSGVERGPGGGPNHSEDIGVSSGINIFNGFRDVANVRRADATADQRRLLLLDLQQTLLANVAQSGFAILHAERSAGVLRNSIRLDQERIRDMRVRWQTGLARPLDVAQTEANLATTQVQLIQAESDARNARTTLAFLAGIAEVSGPVLDDFATAEDIGNLEGHLARALAGRQDLLAAADSVNAAREEIDIQVGRYYPTLGLSVHQVLYQEPGGGNIGSGVLSLLMPIFTAGQIEQDVRVAWSRFRQAELSEQLLRRQVVESVRLAYENLVAARERVVQAGIGRSTAQKALDLATRSYEVGSATNLDRLDAQDALQRAELQLTSATFDQKLFTLQLARATGALGVKDVVALPESRPADSRPAESQPTDSRR